MSHVPNDIHEQLPQFADLIDRLKHDDAHLERLLEDYHTINRQVHRMESDVEPVADDTLRDVRKQRLYLLDEIQEYLCRAHAA